MTMGVTALKVRHVRTIDPGIKKEISCRVDKRALEQRLMMCREVVSVIRILRSSLLPGAPCPKPAKAAAANGDGSEAQPGRDQATAFDSDEEGSPRRVTEAEMAEALGRTTSSDDDDDEEAQGSETPAAAGSATTPAAPRGRQTRAARIGQPNPGAEEPPTPITGTKRKQGFGGEEPSAKRGKDPDAKPIRQEKVDDETLEKEMENVASLLARFATRVTDYQKKNKNTALPSTWKDDMNAELLQEQTQGPIEAYLAGFEDDFAGRQRFYEDLLDSTESFKNKQAKFQKPEVERYWSIIEKIRTSGTTIIETITKDQLKRAERADAAWKAFVSGTAQEGSTSGFLALSAFQWNEGALPSAERLSALEAFESALVELQDDVYATRTNLDGLMKSINQNSKVRIPKREEQLSEKDKAKRKEAEQKAPLPFAYQPSSNRTSKTLALVGGLLTEVGSAIQKETGAIKAAETEALAKESGRNQELVSQVAILRQQLEQAKEKARQDQEASAALQRKYDALSTGSSATMVEHAAALRRLEEELAQSRQETAQVRTELATATQKTTKGTSKPKAASAKTIVPGKHTAAARNTRQKASRDWRGYFESVQQSALQDGSVKGMGRFYKLVVASNATAIRSVIERAARIMGAKGNEGLTLRSMSFEVGYGPTRPELWFAANPGVLTRDVLVNGRPQNKDRIIGYLGDKIPEDNPMYKLYAEMRKLLVRAGSNLIVQARTVFQDENESYLVFGGDPVADEEGGIAGGGHGGFLAPGTDSAPQNAGSITEDGITIVPGVQRPSGRAEDENLPGWVHKTLLHITNVWYAYTLGALDEVPPAEGKPSTPNKARDRVPMAEDPTNFVWYIVLLTQLRDVLKVEEMTKSTKRVFTTWPPKTRREAASVVGEVLREITEQIKAAVPMASGTPSDVQPMETGPLRDDSASPSPDTASGSRAESPGAPQEVTAGADDEADAMLGI